MATHHPTLTEAGPVPRVPLLASVDNRGSNFGTDARIINGYIEKLQDGTVMAIKRPGSSLVTGLAGHPQGSYYWEGAVYCIVAGTLYKDGVAVGVVDATGGLSAPPYSFSSVTDFAAVGGVPALFLHNNAYSYYYTVAGGVVAIAACSQATFGSFLMGGCAYLNSMMFVVLQNGAVRGCAIDDDLTTWALDNRIYARQEPGNAVVIFKQLDYVVVLKETSMESFQWAGNAEGSPLQSASGNALPFGCRSQYSLATIEDTTLWLTGGHGGFAIMMMSSMTPRIVSTPAVSRLLEKTDLGSDPFAIRGTTFRASGHRFYVLTIYTLDFSIVYDIDANEWFQWTDADGGRIQWFNSTTNSADQPIIQREDGSLVVIDRDLGADCAIGPPYATQTFPFEVVTPIWDAGMQYKKYCHTLDVICDQNTFLADTISDGGRVEVRYSDNDYRTWSNWRSIDLRNHRRCLYNSGTFYNRAWDIRYRQNRPFRLKWVELGVLPGDG